MTASSAAFRPDVLKGRAALVTGGGTGICRGIALALAAHGADVAIISRKADHLEPTARELEALGVKAVAIAADVRDPAAVDGAIKAAVDRFGHLDTVVNTSGGATSPSRSFASAACTSTRRAEPFTFSSTSPRPASTRTRRASSSFRTNAWPWLRGSRLEGSAPIRCGYRWLPRTKTCAKASAGSATSSRSGGTSARDERRGTAPRQARARDRGWTL